MTFQPSQSAPTSYRSGQQSAPSSLPDLHPTELSQILNTAFQLTKAATEHARLVVVPEVNNMIAELASLRDLEAKILEQREKLNAETSALDKRTIEREEELNAEKAALEKRTSELGVDERAWEAQKKRERDEAQKLKEQERMGADDARKATIKKSSEFIAPTGFRTEEGASIVLRLEKDALGAGKKLAALLRAFAFAETSSEHDLWVSCIKPLASLCSDFPSEPDLPLRVAQLLSDDGNPWGFRIVIPEVGEFVGAAHQPMEGAKRVSQVMTWGVKDPAKGEIIKRAMVK